MSTAGQQRLAPNLVLVAVYSVFGGGLASADSVPPAVQAFVGRHCGDCHAGGASEGGLDFDSLGVNLDDTATFARWERVFDRVERGEMPPKDAEQPTGGDKSKFAAALSERLTTAHARVRGTTLRRLNRREYQNTLNDLFGTELDLENMLPEDGRSQEFDNVGESLSISLVHLQRYVEAAGKVFDEAVAKSTEAPEPNRIVASYAKTREGEQFIGKKWKLLSDGAVVRFSGGGYPSGMLRGSGVRESGRYRVRITGYAYQSDVPVTFSAGGTSFARGSEKPTYGYFSFAPGEPGKEETVEFETRIERNYMIQIEPHGIADAKRYQRDSIDDYDGPGLAIREVTLEGPLVGEFPSRGHRLVFDGLVRREIEPRNPADKRRSWYVPEFEVVTEDEETDVGRALKRVATEAFRRPVAPADLEPFEALYRAERDAGSSIEDSLRTAVVALFCSPRFLYLQEDAGRLDDHALAARLSYFLSRTTPDDELLGLAADGRLAADDVLRRQTERLLGDPRFERFLVDLADNWLDLREMDFTVPDRRLFPEFDDYLRYSMPLETRAFLRELVESNRPVTNLVKSDFAMLNGRLAEHYGLPAVPGATIRRVPLPAGSRRGGLLSQGSILKVTANGTNTSPVTRGAWVMERLLGETPPPPPPGVPGVEPDVRGASTLRELLDKHRDQENCRACHANIDPPGFALESFNPIGGFRERYRSLGGGDRVDRTVLGRKVNYRLGPAVDASGQLPDGRDFDGYEGFRDHLAADPDRLAHTLAEKLLVFGTGREMGFSDRPEIARIVAESAKRGHGVRDLIHLVVQSEIFRSK